MSGHEDRKLGLSEKEDLVKVMKLNTKNKIKESLLDYILENKEELEDGKSVTIMCNNEDYIWGTSEIDVKDVINSEHLFDKFSIQFFNGIVGRGNTKKERKLIVRMKD